MLKYASGVLRKVVEKFDVYLKLGNKRLKQLKDYKRIAKDVQEKVC